MTYRMPQVKQRVTATLLVTLALWLGGVGCAFCCATGVLDSCCLKEPARAVARPTRISSKSESVRGQKSCCREESAGGSARAGEAVSGKNGGSCSLLPRLAHGVPVASASYP